MQSKLGFSKITTTIAIQGLNKECRDVVTKVLLVITLFSFLIYVREGPEASKLKLFHV